jgi:hypothetical protein
MQKTRNPLPLEMLHSLLYSGNVEITLNNGELAETSRLCMALDSLHDGEMGVSLHDANTRNPLPIEMLHSLLYSGNVEITWHLTPRW